ncbi:hypothetical protein [Halococcus salsus]|uniref:hypothetical protein n=1 Tax=Halococcus salsus TaxID=2162894 RepID=UPI001F0478CB|nr:hypothetical protein [Halococcus salsus]
MASHDTMNRGFDLSSDLGLLARGGLRAAILVGALQLVPLASAHGGTVRIVQWASLLPLVTGLVVVAASIYLGRTLDTGRDRYAVYGVFAGLVLVAAGGVGLVQLSQIQSFSVSQSPIPEAAFYPATLLVGALVLTGSFVAVQLRWPSRPRYAILGIILGLWITYSAVMDALGLYGPTNPVGYLLELALPVTVGYIFWRDCRHLLADLRNDRLARRFGAGIALLAAVFFLFSSGMLSFAIDDGVGLSWTRIDLEIFPILAPLATWPALELFVPRLPFVTPVLEAILPPDLFATPPYVPFRAALSPGVVLFVGLLGGLVGLNGAAIAHFWKGDGADAGENDTTTNAITGALALSAPNACCCCGPVLAEFAVVLLGPSTAMPLYWLFIDLASPVGMIFFGVTILALTGNLVRADRMSQEPRSCVVRVDTPSAKASGD